MKSAKEIVKEMTLDEKLLLYHGYDFWHTNGIERLDIPKLMMCDGPHGLRKQKGQGDHLGINESIETVCYPSASALAASFDEEMLKELGEALGEECQAEDVAMLLGPGVNMKRSPLCGRNFEYFSEDPYLAGKLAAAYVKSLQAQGVASCVKHFAANNQEYCRMSGSSDMDERTLHETYLPAFETVVKEGKTRSIMCAYNGINGEYCSENRMLLTDTLRERWGYEGFVVTDWGAGKDGAKGIQAGLDLHMPGGHDTVTYSVKKALESGELTEEDIDRMAERMVQFVLDYQKSREEYEKCADNAFDRKKCAALSEKLSAECAVLLKNEEQILPLSHEKKVAFIGEFAKQPRFQGSGSSHINVKEAVGAADAVLNGSVVYAQGYSTKETETDGKLWEEAVAVAKAADVAVVFAGLPDSFESEGFDRKTLDMPQNQNELIEAVAEANPNTVVVLHGGAPMLLPWLPKVKGVLLMYLGGQNVGRAAVQLLYGEKNPGGKLAESWPLQLEHNPSYLSYGGRYGKTQYTEGVFIGYRYYDKKRMEVQFPFGYGLSYTSFAYSDLKVDKESCQDTDTVKVTCKVKNTGTCAGKEAVQLYVGDVESEIERPVRELKGFAKIELAPGEEKEVEFVLDFRSFAYYETRIHDWFVESGEFELAVGSSSRDIRLSRRILVEGTKKLPVSFTIYSTIGEVIKTEEGSAFVAKMQAARQTGQEAKKEDQDALGEGGAQMAQAMMLEMPLCSLPTYTGMSWEQVYGIVDALNQAVDKA